MQSHTLYALVAGLIAATALSLTTTTAAAQCLEERRTLMECERRLSPVVRKCKGKCRHNVSVCQSKCIKRADACRKANVDRPKKHDRCRKTQDKCIAGCSKDCGAVCQKQLGKKCKRPDKKLTACEKKLRAGKFTGVSVGIKQTCAVTVGGEVRCWAKHGGASLKPVPETKTPFTSVSVGPSHICGHTRSGFVKCWGGSNTFGERRSMRNMASVSAGDHHNCGLTASGTAHCWGANQGGQAKPPKGTYTSVVAGAVTTCGLAEGGAVRCWGALRGTSPKELSFASLATGSGGAGCGVSTDGLLRCWGSGHSTRPPKSLAATRFSDASIIVGLGCGVTEKGSIQCWRTAEKPLGFKPPKGRFVSVSVGRWQVRGITTKGKVRCVNVPAKSP